MADTFQTRHSPCRLPCRIWWSRKSNSTSLRMESAGKKTWPSRPAF